MDWAALVAALVALLPAVPGCPYWCSMLLSMLARLRKHDFTACVPWDAHVAPLFTQILASFELPIGSASETSPFSRGTPRECLILFGNSLQAGLALCRPSPTGIVLLFPPATAQAVSAAHASVR